MMERPKPFFNWRGGKQRAIKELLYRLPATINDHYEPFLGGGALFFQLFDKVNFSHLSDLNKELINSFCMVKKSPHSVHRLVKGYYDKHSPLEYAQIKEQFNIKPLTNIKKGAMFIYLTNACFNSMYSVNKKGHFNSSIGHCPTDFKKHTILLVSEVLKGAEIKHQSFTKINPQKGDFVYFDPPYDGTNDNYTLERFSKEDHRCLRDFVLDLTKRGVNVMISNSDTPFINDLYNEFIISKITIPQLVSGLAKHRKKTYELLIRNYQDSGGSFINSNLNKNDNYCFTCF